MKASFWLNRLENPEHIIASQSEIEDFNHKNIECLSVNIHDITAKTIETDKEMLYNMLNEQELMEQDLYMDNTLLHKDYFHKILREMDVESIGEKNIAYYGFTVRRTHMRILPTMDFVTNRPGDYAFDRLQQTAVSVAEPLQILHCSASGQWYFVQTYYAAGWIPAAHIAVASREKWLEYALPENFLVVTGNRLRLGFNPYSPEISELEFFMGDKLPLFSGDIPATVDQQSTSGNYVIKLPVRQADGQMDSRLALIPIVSDVSVGYLAYTRRKLIQQAFKMQGDRYGWGGSFGSRDCSSFVMDIYRSFGIRLPRNSWDQMCSLGKTIDFTALTAEGRQRALQIMKPGAALYCKGHVMLYLGYFEEKYYIIHAVAEGGNAGKFNFDGSLAALPLHNIMVTDVSLLRTSGQTILEELIMGKTFE